MVSQTEFDDARLRHAAGVLHAEISRLADGMMMTRRTVERIAEWIEVHRRDCKRMGIDFPEMVVVAFSRLGAIEVCRRDWTQVDIETFIVEMPNKYPGIFAAEIATAVRAAWPGYKPRGLELLAAHRIAPGTPAN